MKKLLFTLFLILSGTSAFAQKEYVTVYITRGSCRVSSDDPSLKREYSGSDFDEDGYAGFIYVAKLLNLLSKKNYTVELQTNINEPSNGWGMMYLLSRPSEGSSNSNAIRKVQADPDEEVTEVARYNLQGMPIGKNEKGIQIVVYSNYTTKTIIVE